MRLLGEFLVAKGWVSKEDIGRALEMQRQSGAPLGDCLVELGVVTHEQIESLIDDVPKAATRLADLDVDPMLLLQLMVKGIYVENLQLPSQISENLKLSPSVVEELLEMTVERKMIEIAEKIIEQQEAAFEPKSFEDRYEKALRELIRRKEKGEKIVTADGTLGDRGAVMEVLPAVADRVRAQVVYAAGPAPTLERVAAFCAERGLPAQVALEERMGCGFGLCYTCVVPVARKDGSGYDNLRSCIDGPVFNPARVLWDRWLGERPTMLPTPPEGLPVVRSWPG